MKKYILLALSILLIPSVTFAQGRNTGIQQVTKQRDIADYKCRNNLPNSRAAIGFCKKRDGLNRKLQNMNRSGNHHSHNKNDYQNNNNHRHHDQNRNHHHHD